MGEVLFSLDLSLFYFHCLSVIIRPTIKVGQADLFSHSTVVFQDRVELVEH